MTNLQLILGDKNYSSWSMRAWVALTAAGVPFDETTIELDTPTAREQKLRHSPAARVPILRHDDLAIWDSLAICEYVAELWPDRSMWPEAPHDRARARSLCAEMHAGFQALRTEMPMNIRRSRPLRDGPSTAARGDIQRIAAIFAAARGPYLLGSFGIVDAFFAPVASRLRSYEIPLDGAAAECAERLLHHDAVRAWFSGALRETHTLPKYDAIG